MHLRRVTRGSHHSRRIRAAVASPAISRSSNCRFRSTAANMRRSPGPRSRAGARTIISPPTRRFAPAASRSRRRRTPPADPKALGTSLRDPCRIAKGLELSDGAEGKGFLRGAFSAAAHLAARRRRGLRHRLLRAHDRRLADAERGLQRAGLSPAVQSVRPRHQAELRPACRTRARCFARSAAASWCPITTAPRSRMARSTAAGSKSAG